MYEDLKIEITSSGAPAVDMDIRRFEREIGVSVPTDYRQFLRERNGGVVSPNVFETATGADYSCGVNEFFGLNAQRKSNDLHEQYVLYVEHHPSELLPVGAAAGGNLICLHLQNKHRGAVFFWDHEVEDSDQTLRKLADSFSAFIHSLRPLRSDEVKLRREDVIEAWIDPSFLEQIDKSE